jgi:steroid 5-alpha reductase family enzyme
VVALTLLFQGSTRMTEELSLTKYPSYGEYQRTTSRLIPWLPRG